jgi:hypothetical protein
MTNQIQIDTFEAPASWASAFINGDCSSFDDREQAEFDAWCAENPEKLWVVDVSEDSENFRLFNGLLTDVRTYTYHAR